MKGFTQVLLTAAVIAVVSVDAKATKKKRKVHHVEPPAPTDDYDFDYTPPTPEEITEPKKKHGHSEPTVEPTPAPEPEKAEHEKKKHKKKHDEEKPEQEPQAEVVKTNTQEEVQTDEQPEATPEAQPEEQPAEAEPVEEVVPEKDPIEIVEDVMYFSREFYLGIYAALFGISGNAVVAKPTQDCFGQWISDDIRELKDFGTELGTDFWTIEFEQCRDVAYSVIDLVFDNDEECHFRKVGYVIYDYCSEPEMCDLSTVIDNVTSNAFALITSVTQVMSIFKENSWTEMDKEGRGYAINQIGHALTTLFVDLWDFKPTRENMSQFADALDFDALQ